MPGNHRALWSPCYRLTGVGSLLIRMPDSYHWKGVKIAGTNKKSLPRRVAGQACKITLFDKLADLVKNVGQPEDADNRPVVEHQQGLVAPQDKLVNRFGQGGVFGNILPF